MEASLALTGEASATGVTMFANEACEGTEALAMYVPSSVAMPQKDLQDLKAYFQRPRLIRRGTLTFGSRTNILQYVANIAGLQAAFPQWNNRLSGVYALRFKMCFRLQIAATAFHQGLVALSFQYGCNTGDLYNYSRGAVPQTCTNLPHARLDLSETTMVELDVPFLYDFEFVPASGIDTAGGVLGVLALNHVLPVISVAGLAVPSYELYIWLEDMEFFGADNNAVTSITLQSGLNPKTVGKGNVIVDEMRKTGVLSNALDSAAKVAGFVSSNVPMLSGVAGPTSWALGIASGVAKYFGFSRPLVQAHSIRNTRVPHVGESQVDLPFNGLAVGPFQGNTLAFDAAVGGTEVDEMSLKFVTSQYSQICKGQVATTDTHALSIYACPVSPCCFWFRDTGTRPYSNVSVPVSTASITGNCVQMASVGYIASFFRLWRGGLRFRFTFAKTKFHGGRYLLSFNPSTNAISAAPSFVAAVSAIDGPEVAGGLVQPYGYSMVMDLRDGNVFEFVVPYVSERPWTNFLSSTGGLSIVCIDPLQASSSVSTTVPFLVEVAGDSDFELADFAGNCFIPYDNPSFLLQSGLTTTVTGLDAGVKTATADPSQYTIGERLLSVKQMIQIPAYTNGPQGAGTTFRTTLPPWWYYSGTAQIVAGGGGTPINVATNFNGCGHHPGALAEMYAFCRGSTDYHVFSPTGATGQMIFSVEQYPNESATTSGVATTNYIVRTNTAATPKLITYGEQPLHVRLPAYQANVRIRPRDLASNLLTRVIGNSVGFTNFALGHFVKLLSGNGGAAANNNIWISCSAGDDATLHHFIGPPPIMIPNAANAKALFPDWYIT